MQGSGERELGSVLVTGASGFIGRRLTARLLRMGAEVRSFDLPGAPVQEGAAPLFGDISDPQAVRSAVAGCDTVFHLAAFVGDFGPWELHQRVTVEGTGHVLRAAQREGARTVLTTSICAYGDAVQRGVCFEDTPFGGPQSVYDRAKQAQEKLASEAREEGADVVVVRPSNVSGGGSGPWCDGFVAALRAGKPAVIGRGDGDAGLIHVENLIDILLRAALVKEASGQTFNAADTYGVTWRAYAEDLARLAGAAPPASLGRRRAYLLAHAAETFWRLSGRKDRPPLTLGSLNLVGHANRFDMSKTRKILAPPAPRPYEDLLADLKDYLDGPQPMAAAPGRAFGN